MMTPAWRFTLARRTSQLLVLTLFIGTARWGWTIGGEPILSGTLSASKLLGIIPLSDPLALLERLCAGILPAAPALLGAAIVLGLYALLGSRTFCGWICPMNIVVEAAAWCRSKAELPADVIRVPRASRYVVLAASLLASAVTGYAAFELASPQALLWRDLVWGSGLAALSVAAAVFALEFALMKDGWCGRLCPLGAMWSCVGRAQKHPIVRIGFSPQSCTHCGQCLKVCQEQQIIRFKTLDTTRRIPTGECLNCGRCIAVCEPKALSFENGWRPPRPVDDRKLN